MVTCYTTSLCDYAFSAVLLHTSSAVRAKTLAALTTSSMFWYSRPPVRDVEVTPLAHHGSPSITRTTFPTCRAHYPGGSSGCVRRLLPRLRGLPQMAGGSASALSLSRPAQASLALRPAGLLSRPKRPLSRGSSSAGHPAKTARQLPDQSTTLRVESSSTDDSRLRGALPLADSVAIRSKHHSRPCARRPHGRY